MLSINKEKRGTKFEQRGPTVEDVVSAEKYEGISYTVSSGSLSSF
jgi:hypothetical protein